MPVNLPGTTVGRLSPVILVLRIPLVLGAEACATYRASQMLERVCQVTWFIDAHLREARSYPSFPALMPSFLLRLVHHCLVKPPSRILLVPYRASLGPRLPCVLVPRASAVPSPFVRQDGVLPPRAVYVQLFRDVLAQDASRPRRCQLHLMRKDGDTYRLGSLPSLVHNQSCSILCLGQYVHVFIQKCVRVFQLFSNSLRSGYTDGPASPCYTTHLCPRLCFLQRFLVHLKGIVQLFENE